MGKFADRRVPTITDVAREAKVSRATVSRAFGQPQMLSEKMVAHVKAVASRLGYIPNHTARALSTGRAGNIGLIVPDITNPFFASLMRGVQSRALQTHHSVFLGDADENPHQEDALMDKLAAQVDGFILASSRLPTAAIMRHAARRPFVLVNRDLPNLPRVLVDGSMSFSAAVDHLVALGHKSIAYVAGPKLSWSNGRRLRSVLAAGERHSVRIVQLATLRPTFEAGEACVRELIASNVTAVIAYDDLIAQGIMGGLAREGLYVPADFSVIGCDGVLATRIYPPLTSIEINCAEAGEQAVDLLVGTLSGTVTGAERVALPTDLVIRATTAAPPAIRAGKSRKSTGSSAQDSPAPTSPNFNFSTKPDTQ